MTTDQDSSRNSSSIRRHIVLALAILLLVICVWVKWRFDGSGNAKLVGSATGRIGLVLAALWLAWPTLQKPAKWLPPGFAVLGIGVLALLAAQPRLIIVLVPAFSALLVLASIVRSMNRN